MSDKTPDTESVGMRLVEVAEIVTTMLSETLKRVVECETDDDIKYAHLGHSVEVVDELLQRLRGMKSWDSREIEIIHEVAAEWSCTAGHSETSSPP